MDGLITVLEGVTLGGGDFPSDFRNVKFYEHDGAQLEADINESS